MRRIKRLCLLFQASGGRMPLAGKKVPFVFTDSPVSGAAHRKGLWLLKYWQKNPKHKGFQERSLLATSLACDLWPRYITIQVSVPLSVKWGSPLHLTRASRCDQTLPMPFKQLEAIAGGDPQQRYNSSDQKALCDPEVVLRLQPKQKYFVQHLFHISIQVSEYQRYFKGLFALLLLF